MKTQTLTKDKTDKSSVQQTGTKVFFSISLFESNTSNVKWDGNDIHVQALSGTGTVSSELGTTSYLFAGSVTFKTRDNLIGIRDLTLTGKRLSGYYSGGPELHLDHSAKTTLENGEFNLPLNIIFSDSNNESLEIEMELTGSLNGEVLQSAKLEGSGYGFAFSEFLADGESLDEESQDEEVDVDDSESEN